MDRNRWPKNASSSQSSSSNQSRLAVSASSLEKLHDTFSTCSSEKNKTAVTKYDRQKFQEMLDIEYTDYLAQKALQVFIKKQHEKTMAMLHAQNSQLLKYYKELLIVHENLLKKKKMAEYSEQIASVKRTTATINTVNELLKQDLQKYKDIQEQLSVTNVKMENVDVSNYDLDRFNDLLLQMSTDLEVLSEFSKLNQLDAVLERFKNILKIKDELEKEIMETSTSIEKTVAKVVLHDFDK